MAALVLTLTRVGGALALRAEARSASLRMRVGSFIRYSCTATEGCEGCGGGIRTTANVATAAGRDRLWGEPHHARWLYLKS